MKKFAVITLALILGACTPSQEDQAASMDAVQYNLPDGCELTYAGNVEVAGSSRSSRIFVVKCGNVVTTSETRVVRAGKGTHPRTGVTVSY